MGVLLGAAGAGILMVLMRIPERLDTLLLVSTAIANLISGLSRLSIGVLQLTGVMVVVLVTLFALMLLVGGGHASVAGGGPSSWQDTLTPRPGPQPCNRWIQSPASCHDDQRKAARISQLSQGGRWLPGSAMAELPSRGVKRSCQDLAPIRCCPVARARLSGGQRPTEIVRRFCGCPSRTVREQRD